MRGLEEEREYAERCRDALLAMVAGARENVVVGEDTWGDRYTAERLGYYLKSLARELGDEGDGPPFFGLIGYGDGRGCRGASRAGVLPRAAAHLGRDRPAAAGDRLARAGVDDASTGPAPKDPRGITTRRRFGWSGRTPSPASRTNSSPTQTPAATDLLPDSSRAG